MWTNTQGDNGMESSLLGEADKQITVSSLLPLNQWRLEAAGRGRRPPGQDPQYVSSASLYIRLAGSVNMFIWFSVKQTCQIKTLLCYPLPPPTPSQS